VDDRPINVARTILCRFFTMLPFVLKNRNH
jgi:hypothetical protein